MAKTLFSRTEIKNEDFNFSIQITSISLREHIIAKIKDKKRVGLDFNNYYIIMKRIFYSNVEIKLSYKEVEGNFYIYKTSFPDAIENGVVPYYYGKRKFKGDILSDKYIGSPKVNRKVFLEQIEKNNKIIKEIICLFCDEIKCSDFENKLTEEHYGKEGCLNGSRFSPTCDIETLREIGMKCKTLKKGLFSMTKEQLRENAKRAYAAGLGKMSNEERKSIQRRGILKRLDRLNESDIYQYYKKIGANGGKIGGKKAHENKNGIHDQNNPRNKEGRAKGHKKLAEKYAKEFSIIDPNGNLIKIKNLNKFCRDNNLNRGNIMLLLRGKIKSSLGWTKPKN